jgi:5'-deoxynucleotidase
MDYDFFAYLSRMKYIKRWALMRSIDDENVKEHSWDVTVIAHAIALIENKIFDGNVDEYKVMCFSAYHETGEVITGDLPTPIKYFNSQINTAYKDLEKLACEKLLSKLPEEVRSAYTEFVIANEDSLEYKIMKSADKIAAYIKCVDEIKSGNKEFLKAKETLWQSICEIDMKSVKYFVEKILPSFEKTLDELEL